MSTRLPKAVLKLGHKQCERLQNVSVGPRIKGNQTSLPLLKDYGVDQPPPGPFFKQGHEQHTQGDVQEVNGKNFVCSRRRQI